MCSIVFSDSKTKAVWLLFLGLLVLGVSGAGTNFTTTPKDKEVFVGDSVQFDWDYVDSQDVSEVRFGVLVPVPDSETPQEVAIYVKKKEKDGSLTLKINNQAKSIEWIRDRVEVVPDRRASFRIKPVEMNDSRTFFCLLMTKSKGSVTDTVKLTAVDLLIDKQKSTKAYESWQGRKLTVLCAVRVPPAANAKFSWTHVPSNRVIAREKHDDTRSKSYLMLTTYKDEDFEALQCRAETKMTVKFHVINITKLSSPTEPQNLKSQRVFNREDARSFLRLYWDPPKNNGGSEIESYLVSYVPKGLPWKSSTNKETEKPELSHDLSLPYGNIYNARVRAKNKAGTGPPSNEIEINLDGPDEGLYSHSTTQHRLEACLLLVSLMVWVF